MLFIKNLLTRWFPELPVLTPMPKHVADLNLDMGLMMLAMDRAHNINPAVKTGIIMPPKKEG